jgi:hypothetical protein
MWWPLNPIELKSVTILNEGKRVKIGTSILFKVHYIKHTDKAGTVYRQLINDRVVNYSPHISAVPSGEAKRIGFIRTSNGEMPGKYQVNYTVVYEYFGFRDVVTNKLSDEFEIVKGS